MSLINIMKRIGPRTEPCGIPDFTLAEDEYASSTRTFCDLSFKNDLIHTHVLPTSPTLLIFWRSLACETRSKALAKSV